MKMKRAAMIAFLIVLVASLLVSSVESRRALLNGGGGGGAQKGTGSKSSPSSSSGEVDQKSDDVSYPEGTIIDNHHNIPRESFSGRGGDGTNSDIKDGSG